MFLNLLNKEHCSSVNNVNMFCLFISATHNDLYLNHILTLISLILGSRLENHGLELCNNMLVLIGRPRRF